MKKSRIIALLTAAVMIISVVPAMASTRASESGYFVDEEGGVYKKSEKNLISNPGFENGLTGLTKNDEYYVVSSDEAHSGSNSLKAIKSTKGDGAITAYFAVDNPEASYYLSFWYKNADTTTSRRPRVTFAFNDSKVVPTEENDFTDETNAWIGAGTASNDQDMEYSMGEWKQYSTVIKGNGTEACKYVVLHVYGLTKEVAYVDDFELYTLNPSEEYGEMFTQAVENWANVEKPAATLSGVGEISLEKDTGVDGIGVKWLSSSESIDTENNTYYSGSDEELVILTARLYVEDEENIFYDFSYPCIVKSMFDPYVEWLQANTFATIGNSISGDIELPVKLSIDNYVPATFIWSCSDPDILTSKGKFTEPETTKDIDLIVTIKCDGIQKTVTKRVKARGGNIVPDGLVMYYDFEDVEDLTVIPDQSRNAKTYNASASGIKIVDGMAQFSGGNSVINLPSNYATELTKSYTVSMWVKPDKSLASKSALYRFFDFGGTTTNSQFLAYVPNTGTLQFMDRGQSGSISKWDFSTTVPNLIDTWSLLTLVYDFTNSPATAKLYVDGKLITSSNGEYSGLLTKSVFEQVGSSSSTGFIGRTQWMNGDNPDFIGFMDDVRIYKRAITDVEIQTLYNETRPTVTAPVTIKYYDIDGNKIKDDVTVSAEVNKEFDVDASYKTLPFVSDGQARLAYKFVASKSTDSVVVSESGENVCKLVFKLVKAVQSANLLPNPSFENGVTGWTTNNYGTQITAGSNGFSLISNATDGSKALQLTSAQGSGSAGALSTKWKVEPNTEYTFKVDIMHDNNGDKTTGFLEMLNDNNESQGHIAGDNPGRVWSGSGEYLPTVANTWVTVEYVFTTTATTTQLGFKLAWIGAERPAVVDNFSLTKWVEASDDEEDVSELVPVTVKFVDADGNKVKSDLELEVDIANEYYSVSDAEKVIEMKQSGSMVYIYRYNEEESEDVIRLSKLNDNVCTVVFDIIKADMNASNLVTDGGFEDENGDFSWGTWQSPETMNFFKDTCEGWFYKVNRDTNASVLYKEGGEIEADDYALGTRWNDGVKGLCSLANFIKVEAGKDYVISYDYKHKTAGTSPAYISTYFTRGRALKNEPQNFNNPVSVTTNWQTNTFAIRAESDGFICFHFSYVGADGNPGAGPYWYFDNFKVVESITFENKITYSAGYAEIVAEDGTEGYLVQAFYDKEGALKNVEISDKLTLNKETATKVEVTKGAKLILIKDITSLEPLAPSIIAE